MAEPEDVALPRPHSTRVDIAPEDQVKVARTKSNKFKVWKTKAWKRRTTERVRRAKLYQQGLAEA